MKPGNPNPTTSNYRCFISGLHTEIQTMEDRHIGKHIGLKRTGHQLVQNNSPAGLAIDCRLGLCQHFRGRCLISNKRPVFDSPSKTTQGMCF